MVVSELTRPSRIALLTILLLGLGLRSCHLVNHLHGDLGKIEETFTSSDMHAFTVWARKIAAGDWLCRDTYHPYMNWMNGIGPLEQFEKWWGGKEIYHQTPLYAYLLAVCLWVFGTNVPLLILQVLTSSAALYLVFDLGRRFLDVRAGLVAAGIAAVFAPSVVLDATQLRASFNSTLTLLSIWLLLRVRDQPDFRRGLLAGLCLAASYLLRPTGLMLLVLGPALLLLEKSCRGGARRWGVALGLGALLLIAPFLVRNLVVGAPFLSLSTRGPETVIQANRAQAEPGFMSLPGKEEYVRMMDAGSGSLLSALGAAIESWPEDGRLGWWLWHQGQKLLCVFGDYEYANNINFYYYRELTPLLDKLPTFGWFVGAGIMGILLLFRFSPDRRGLWIPLVAGAALVLGCLLGFSLGRYRMPLAMLMTIPAGAAVSLAVYGIREKRSWFVIALVCSSVLWSVLSFMVLPSAASKGEDQTLSVQPDSLRRLSLETTRIRPQEYIVAAQTIALKKDTQRAAAFLRAYRDRYVATINRLVARFQADKDGYGMFASLQRGQATLGRIASLAGNKLKDRNLATQTQASANRMKAQAEALVRANRPPPR